MMNGEKKERYLMVLWIFIVVFIMGIQFQCELGWGDDLVFGAALQEKTLLQFLYERYTAWSSRIVIESLLAFIASINPIVWRILNGLMINLIILMMAKIFGNKQLEARVLCAFFLFLIPLESVKSAGWMATTMNYVWVLAFGLVALVPLKKWYEQKECAWWEHIVFCLAILYAANLEQMSAILFGAYLVYGLYFIIQKKRLSWQYWMQFALIVVSTCFILASPGNQTRILVEAGRYLPEFTSFSFIEKLYIGFLTTSQYYMAENNGNKAFILLATVLIIAVVRSKKNKWYAYIIAMVPVLYAVGVTYILKFLVQAGFWGRGLRLLEVLWNNFSISQLSGFDSKFILIQAVCYLVIWICVFGTIYLIHGHSLETYLQWIILIAGLLSRMIVGFTPNMYVSGDRTAIFATVSILILVLRNIQRSFESIRVDTTLQEKEVA